MIDRIAVDSNAAIEHLRNAGTVLPPLREAREIMLPLLVLGELLAGALASKNVAVNLRALEELTASWTMMFSDSAYRPNLWRASRATAQRHRADKGQ
jgi:predicted nucleic acid-binding protein